MVDPEELVLPVEPEPEVPVPEEPEPVPDSAPEPDLSLPTGVESESDCPELFELHDVATTMRAMQMSRRKGFRFMIYYL